MEVYRNEEEQIAALKNWWRANGAIFLLVLVLTVSFTVGWRYWSYRQQRHLKHAAILYQQLINVDSTPRSDTKALESHIRNNYKATLYLDFIRLMKAEQAVRAKHWQVAIQELDDATENATSLAIKSLARLRLARLYIYMQKPQEAIKVLSNVSMNTPWIHITRARAYLALKQYSSAKSELLAGKKSIQGAEMTYSLAWSDRADGDAELLAAIIDAYQEKIMTLENVQTKKV